MPIFAMFFGRQLPQLESVVVRVWGYPWRGIFVPLIFISKAAKCRRPPLNRTIKSSKTSSRSFTITFSPGLQNFRPKMADNFSNFVTHDDRFRHLTGQSPTLELLIEHNEYPFAHEAGVFFSNSNELFITSNQFITAEKERCIQISKISLGDGTDKPKWEEIQFHGVPMANGGVNYKEGILFCAQGNMSEPSGLYYMPPEPPYKSELVVSSFYGREFNSVNDVVIHSDGSIWFTDPIYGFEQGYRPKPNLPNQVYRYDPRTKNIRAMADGFGRPNGICFSPDEKIVYITDTDWIHGDGSTNGMRPSSM
jgi:gluconolactonase